MLLAILHICRWISKQSRNLVRLRDSGRSAAPSKALTRVSGLTCGFSWECQSGCEQDFRCWCGHCGFCVCARIGFACSQTCPQDWTEVQMNPGICTVGRSLCFACIRDHAPSHVFRGADNVCRRFNQVDLDAQQWMFFYCLCLQGLVVSV